MEKLESELKILLVDERSVKIWKPLSSSGKLVSTIHEFSSYSRYNVKIIDNKICISEEDRISIYFNIADDEYDLLHQFTLQDIDVYYEDSENICYISKQHKLIYNGKGILADLDYSSNDYQIELTKKYIVLYSGSNYYIIDRDTCKIVKKASLVKCLLSKGKLVYFNRFANNVEVIDLDSLSVKTVSSPEKINKEYKCKRIGETGFAGLLGALGDIGPMGTPGIDFLEMARTLGLVYTPHIETEMSTASVPITPNEEKKLAFKFSMNLTHNLYNLYNQCMCIMGDYFIFKYNEELFRVNIVTGEIISAECSLYDITTNNSTLVSFNRYESALRIKDLSLEVLKDINPLIQCDNVLLTDDSKIIITGENKVKIFNITGELLEESDTSATSIYVLPSTKKEKDEINGIVAKETDKYLNKNLIGIVTKFIV